MARADYSKKLQVQIIVSSIASSQKIFEVALPCANKVGIYLDSQPGYFTEFHPKMTHAKKFLLLKLAVFQSPITKIVATLEGLIKGMRIGLLFAQFSSSIRSLERYLLIYLMRIHLVYANRNLVNKNLQLRSQFTTKLP
uniref:AlNc14C470G11836 protein n=1 Tax=Albugo laibachii Nc14 TaxID=890382 RepID=F0X098_9STRA|nr:AlNc14C470G11836 [Albugo laibachii Nc14]|eukprot:CCA27180.1 AlNc14C470G11836 [Albugo laibachii Nc14]